MHKRRLRNWVKVAILSLGIILTTLFLFISSVLLYRSYNPATHEKSLLVSYNSEDNISYKVSAKTNSYFSDDDLVMGKEYVSSILDDLTFNVSYEFNSSKVLDYKYDYSIIATLVGNYNNGNKDSELWSKKFDLEPETNVNLLDANSFKIEKSFQIDYQTYNNVMQSFKKEFNLMVDAYLNIDFKVNVKSTVSSDNQIDESDVINIKIPLLGDTTHVKYTKMGVIDNNIWTTVDDVEQTSVFLKIMYGLGVIFSFILDFLLLVKAYKISEKDRYEYEINKIFKSYAEILVAIEEIPEHLSLKNIKVSNFKDMIDVNEELHLPIIYFENKNEVDFFIMSDIYCYEYIIKREKVNKMK